MCQQTAKQNYAPVCFFVYFLVMIQKHNREVGLLQSKPKLSYLVSLYSYKWEI